MNYKLEELLDIPTLRDLLDSLDEINSMPSAIIDTEGKILTATAWQDICTKFHRVNPDTAKKCTESDIHIKANVAKSGSRILYRCPMGLIDCAAPIIIEGKHLGNVFIGQFFMDPPDEQYFMRQAEQYGFDDSKYMEAMRKVPLFSVDQLQKNLTFIGNLVQMLAEQGLVIKRQLESERALRESETKLKVIFNTSEAGIIVVSTLGIITYANRRMGEMFGMTLPELIGSSYSDHLHESEKEAGVQRMAQIIKGEIKSVVLDRHYIRKDGTEFWGHLTGTRLDNADGSMRDQIIVISDITERRVAEEKKLLLERQFQEAQKLESLGVLAGGIAHDFNNILAVIMCYSSLAKQKPEKAGEFMPEIEKAVERAAELCRQMLAYAGKTQFVESSVNVTSLVDEMLRMLKATLPQNVTIKPSISDDIPPIKADAGQLRQIVMSLVINSSEAIGEEQGEIHVSLVKSEVMADQSEKDHTGRIIPAGSYILLEVYDNGCGMDDETKKRVFEPFYSTKFPGRGLGMSAVLGITTSHGGRLQLYSQPGGKGTRIKVYLPCQAADTAAELPHHIPSLVPWQGSGTILLVEDEPQIMDAARGLLETLGFSVIGASNGIEAIEQYRKKAEKIRLVVTDIGMPMMSGYELFRELKKINPELPIVISSGFADTVVTSRIANEGIAGLISKPYSFNQLRDVLRGVVGGTYENASELWEYV
jgi:PAS domain S-box-containing protein